MKDHVGRKECALEEEEATRKRLTGEVALTAGWDLLRTALDIHCFGDGSSYLPSSLLSPEQVNRKTEVPGS